MNNDTQRVLEMLSESKITVEEAERLLEALGGHGSTPDQASDLITETETREDGEREVGEETDRRESIGPGPGVKMGAGAFVSPGVKFPPGSAIGMGAMVHEGVVVESAIKVGMGAVIGAGTKIGADAKIDMGVVIGEKATIGAGAILGMGAIVGDDAEVSPGSHVPDGGNVPAGAVW